MSGGGKSGEVVTGYRYFMDIHVVACRGPVDSISKIHIGEREAWSGNVTASTTVNINAPELFGGDEREGGVAGDVDVMMGEATQPINQALAQAVGGVGFTYTYVMQKSATPIPVYTVTRQTVNNVTGASSTETLIATLDVDAANAVFVRNDTTITTTSGGVVTITTIVQGGLVPGYRGVLSFFFRNFFWSSNNPYFKSPWFDLTRILKGWRDDNVWYSSKAVITASDGYKDMNPVHIIVQCLTDMEFGMGYNIADLDDANFKAAADQLYTEGFGLSLQWNSGQSIEEFVKMICTHINASLRLNLSTGLFQIKLIRDDYDIEDLVELNTDNILEMKSFQRKALGDTCNHLVMTYTGRDENPKTISLDNLANINSQGGIIPAEREYIGIRDDVIAGRVLMRDLATVSSALAKVTLSCNRVAATWAEGDVFLLNWTPEGINGVPFRIASINKGNLERGAIEIEAVEDIFGLPNSSYIAVEPGGWVDPTSAPHVVFAQRAAEAPYYEVVQIVPTANLDTYPDDYAFGQLFATYGAGASGSFEIHASPNSTLGNYEKTGTGHYQAYAKLSLPLAQEVSSTVYFDSGRDLDLVEDGDYCYIDNECIEVTSINLSAGTFVAGKRAVLDAVPVAHAAGAAIWFVSGNNYEMSQRVQGELVYYRVLPKTGLGTLPIASASEMQYTMVGRPYRPYPPGNVKLNGAAYPVEISGELTVTWSHRDRLQQTVSLTSQTAGNIGPEAGTTYTLRLYGTAGTLLRTVTGLTSTTYTWSTEAADSGGSLNEQIRIELESVRDGVVSWQKHNITVQRSTGYGMGYGMYYGGTA